MRVRVPALPILVSLALVCPVLVCPVLGASPAWAAAPAIGCPSLANLRLLLRQAADDPAAAAAVLGNEKADHLGCVVLARDAVTALAEHVALNGRAYDCVSLRTTSICHWTVAGTVVPSEPQRAGRKAPAEKPSSPTKPEPRR